MNADQLLRMARRLIVYSLGCSVIIWVGGTVTTLPIAVLFLTPEPSPYVFLSMVLQWPLTFPLWQAFGLSGGLSFLLLTTAILFCNSQDEETTTWNRFFVRIKR